MPAAMRDACRPQCGCMMRPQCVSDARTDGRTNGRILNLRNAMILSVTRALANAEFPLAVASVPEHHRANQARTIAERRAA